VFLALFTTTTPNHKNTSFSWKNLTKKWTIVNNDIMATNFSKSFTSNNNCRLLLMALKLKCISKFTFISNVWYHSSTFFVGDNIDIHLHFMFHSNLLPFISIISTNLNFKWYIKLLQKNWCKHYRTFKKYYTNFLFENVCTKELVQWGHVRDMKKKRRVQCFCIGNLTPS